MAICTTSAAIERLSAFISVSRVNWNYDEVRSWDFVTRFTFLMENQGTIRSIHNTVSDDERSLHRVRDHFKELRGTKGRMNYEFMACLSKAKITHISRF